MEANISISASSSRYPLTPQDCLLSIRRTWCAEFDDEMQYLQIDLKRNSYIEAIITQGAVVEESWVENYTISYGHSYDLWKKYEENGSSKVNAVKAKSYRYNYVWRSVGHGNNSLIHSLKKLLYFSQMIISFAFTRSFREITIAHPLSLGNL